MHDLLPLTCIIVFVGVAIFKLLSRRGAKKKLNRWRVLVVDCGSGMTRGHFYSQDSFGVVVEKWTNKGQDVRLPPLADAIEKGPRPFLHHLKQAVCGHSMEGMVLGATAGLRQVLEDGKVTQEMVESFKADLAVVTGARFVQLDGDEEARLEHVAARFLGEKVLGKSVHMMSTGGASSQVAYGDTAISLKTSIIATTEAILERGPDVLDAYAMEMNPVVERVPADLGGTFFMIEFFAVFAERCIKTLVGQVVPISDALAAVNTYLHEWYVSAPVELCKSDDSETNEAGGVVWGSKKRFVVHGVTAVLLRKLLGRLREDSELYFIDSCYMDGREIKASWALGLYLDTIGNHARGAGLRHSIE